MVINLKGVYTTNKKDGSVYYRASFTYKGKHIALGSFDNEKSAAKAYNDAIRTVSKKLGIDDYNQKFKLSFDKFVSIVNFRDNNMYLPNPIYVRKRYFSYYLTRNEEYKFSTDDLFFYMNHKILKRGGHLYVNDYGMQLTLLNRYGIKNYAIEGKDYRFVNGDNYDLRYENIEVLNTYYGVEFTTYYGKTCFKAKIHIKGDFVVGYYEDAVTAAVAYNKAIDTLKKNGVNKEFMMNYVEEIGAKRYAQIYTNVDISDSIKNYKC